MKAIRFWLGNLYKINNKELEKHINKFDKKNDFNKNQGITLIALIVTIVVLLILAGVSINLVLGNNGVIKKSKEAKEEYNKSSVKEKVGLLLNEYAINNQTEEEANLAKFLRQNLQVGVAENGDNTYNFILGEYQVTTK